MKEDLQALLAKLPKEELAKAVKDYYGFDGIRYITDLWHDQHKVLDAKETTAGPSMVQSGEGADKAMKDYSNPAPQIGITKEYEELMSNGVAVFEEVKMAAKAIVEAAKNINEAAKSLKTDKAIAKSELWSKLSDIQKVIAKAESAGIELVDAGLLNVARKLVEEAEKHIGIVESNELADARELASLKAKGALSDAWDALFKARALDRYGLKGDGNQSDSAVKDSEGSSIEEKNIGKEGEMLNKAKSEKKDKKDKKSKKEKAAKLIYKAMKAKVKLGEASSEDVAAAQSAYFSAKAERLGQAVVKAAEKEEKKEKEPMHEDAKEEKKETMKESAKSEVSPEYVKAVADRVNLLESNIKNNSHRPTVVPILFKAAGIKSDDMAQNLYTKIEDAIEAGALSEDEAVTARGLVGRYRSAGEGNIPATIVNKQLDQAPVAVQDLFTKFAELPNA
jgi:hypothetical protein